MKEGYKKTELGVIPDEWEIKTAGDIFEFTGGLSISREKLGEEGVNYLHYGDIHKRNENFIDLDIDEQWLPKFNKEYENIKEGAKLETGDVVFADASEDYEGIGKSVAILNYDNKPFVAGLHTIVGKEKCNLLDEHYKRFCFSTTNIRKQFRSLATGSSVYGIKMSSLKRIKILTPPLKEQQKIAQILSTVDSQIDDTDKLIEKTKELKKGLMQRLLTKGIGHKEFKKTEVGEIPVEWEVIRLGEIVNIKSGNSPSKFNFYDDGKYPFFKVDDMNYSTKYLSIGKLYYNESNFDLMNRGMIIFPKRGASIFTNKILILDSDGFFDTNLMGLICNEKVNNEFLYYFLSYYELSKIADTSSIPQINNKHIEPLIISLPEMKEQKQIANILSSVDSQIEEYQNKKTKLEELKKGLMQQLLTGKVRVV
ncbi:restriction endonuclease subunit S [Clostridium algidicarnis]|uniref:Restriction endonuclease subunit S n=1 Tax=Clostridium algidicarnis TaxID=37659 RepID=A0ABS6C211_9CLOT|nr:restriction endonuclease subunit S [Clostridium algidicarnis]MBU3219500.1 restriction endonuclease subunit S [Clostridium algidicarnis]